MHNHFSSIKKNVCKINFINSQPIDDCEGNDNDLPLRTQHRIALLFKEQSPDVVNKISEEKKSAQKCLQRFSLKITELNLVGSKESSDLMFQDGDTLKNRKLSTNRQQQQRNLRRSSEDDEGECYSFDEKTYEKKNVLNQTSSGSNCSSSSIEGNLSLVPPNCSVNFNNDHYNNKTLHSCSTHCMSGNFDAFIGVNGERTGSLSVAGSSSNRSNSNINRSVSIKHSRYHRSALFNTCSVDTSKITQTSLTDRFYCLCGSCHVVVGAKLFLVLYLCLTMFGIVFGMVSTLVWTLIPIFVIPMAFRAFWTRNSKYLYPFLIITIIQMVVCLLMAFIVTVFAIFNYEKLFHTIAQLLIYNNFFVNNTVKRHSAIFFSSKVVQEAEVLSYHNLEYTTLTVTLITSTIFACFLLTTLFGWQILVLSSCIDYYEIRSHRGEESNSTFSKVSEHINRPQSSYNEGGLAKLQKINTTTMSKTILTTTLSAAAPIKRCSSNTSQMVSSFLTYASQNNNQSSSTKALSIAEDGTSIVTMSAKNSADVKTAFSSKIIADELLNLSNNTKIANKNSTLPLTLDDNCTSKLFNATTNTMWVGWPLELSPAKRYSQTQNSLPFSELSPTSIFL